MVQRRQQWRKTQKRGRWKHSRLSSKTAARPSSDCLVQVAPSALPVPQPISGRRPGRGVRTEEREESAYLSQPLVSHLPSPSLSPSLFAPYPSQRCISRIVTTQLAHTLAAAISPRADVALISTTKTFFSAAQNALFYLSPPHFTPPLSLSSLTRSPSPFAPLSRSRSPRLRLTLLLLRLTLLFRRSSLLLSLSCFVFLHLSPNLHHHPRFLALHLTLFRHPRPAFDAIAPQHTPRVLRLLLCLCYFSSRLSRSRKRQRGKEKKKKKPKQKNSSSFSLSLSRLSLLLISLPP